MREYLKVAESPLLQIIAAEGFLIGLLPLNKQSYRADVLVARGTEINTCAATKLGHKLVAI